jgi:hypothetical protein
MDKQHYICLGKCKGMAERPGTCQALDCNHYGHILLECSCIDDMHNDVKQEDYQAKDDNTKG